MAALQPIEYADASPEVRAVYDDIKQTRQIKDVNNFWKYLAHDPATLRRTWLSLKEIMAPGALDAVTKEMIYLAVSVTNGCGYCVASHGAAARRLLLWVPCSRMSSPHRPHTVLIDTCTGDQRVAS